MSLLRRDAARSASLEAYLTAVGRTTRAGSSAHVSLKSSMSHSVIWGATRLRAGLVSLMPVDTYRRVGNVSVEVPKPRVLTTPSQVAEYHPMSIGEWMYSSQTALDRTGNVVGIVKERDGLGLPARIDLVDPDLVSFRMKGSQIVEYRVSGEVIPPEYVWHERQYTVAGIPIGLSPITAAALSLTAGLSALEFAVDWFENGSVVSGHLRNSARVLGPGESEKALERWKAMRENGGLFVSGRDWEYTPMAAKAAESQFIEQMHYTDADLCRFMGVPADMLDVVTNASGSLTYANITQRNLQLLVMNLGDAINRREDALSGLLKAPRFVKLNESAVLRMDPKSRAELMKMRIESRTITPDEARALEDQEPLTEQDYAQFDRLFGNPDKADPVASLTAALAGGTSSTSAATDAQEARAIAELIQKIYLGVGIVLTADEAREIANRAGAGLTGEFTPTGKPMPGGQ